MNQISFINSRLFDNAGKLFDNAEWYPQPQSNPQTIQSFARGHAYIFCIDKALLVFRMIFENDNRNARNNYQKGVIGIDILLEHNLPANALQAIEKIFSNFIFGMMGGNPREVASLVVQYCDFNTQRLEILHRLVIQEAIVRRKSNCAASFALGNRLEIPECTREDIENFHTMHCEKTYKQNKRLAKHAAEAETDFKTTTKETRWIKQDATYLPEDSRPHTSRYITSNYQPLPNPVSPLIQPIIAELVAPLEARERAIPPLEIPDMRSCLEMIGDFLKALWETISDCFFALVHCCCG